ncbi:MAG: tetratricopeptide repeat protein [Crocinitomicaceae bacterium]|nr:tetratricopeptide repeat protein [Crocinitomicaceae bacterium]
MPIRFVLLIFLISQYFWTQNYGDKKFYLIDSLNLDNISDSDKELIDTSLALYHLEKHDTTKLDLIEHIVDECWDESIWPIYNSFIFEHAYKQMLVARSQEEQRKFASLLAGSISNIGYIYDNQGNVTGALEYYHKSLEIYERIGDNDGASSIFNNLGVLYSAQGDTSKAMYYHNESLRLKKLLGDDVGVSLSLNNIGTIYKNRGRVFEALDCFEKSLRICKKNEDLRGMAICYDNIGGVYYSEGYVLKAIDFYQKAYEIRVLNGEYSGAAFSLNNIASVYLSMGKLNEALTHAKRSLDLAQEIGYPMDIQNASESLYKIYNIKSDFKNALLYHELYVAMRDSLHNENNERAILSQALKYEYEKEILKKNLEHLKQQEIKDLQIKERDATINQEKTMRYALVIGMLLMVYVVYISVRNYRRKQKDNELIQLQKNEVESQKQKIEKQHHILEETYKEISDSITYAKRIQQAILPPTENISAQFKDSFIWYQPKDVVSGDFFWMESFAKASDSEGKDLGEKITILAVADCTGHGVPGAMVSVVCHNALNRSVLEFGLTSPSDILNKTRELVIETFDKSGGEVKDGMDISIICLNSKLNQIKYAGANNNLYVIRQGLLPDPLGDRTEISLNDESLCTLIELKSDKQPIGRFAKAKPFSDVIFSLEPDDQIYLFTDGLADQFGGPKGKKFKYQQFKELLVKNHRQSMEKQMDALSFAFENWKGELEQVDDVCIIGVRP